VHGRERRALTFVARDDFDGLRFGVAVLDTMLVEALLDQDGDLLLEVLDALLLAVALFLGGFAGLQASRSPTAGRPRSKKADPA
jgi:hypothetical protein